MSDRALVNVTDVIDRHRLGPMQIRIILLCGLIALLDGMDLQSIGLAAPGIAGALHIPMPRFGVVFSAALAGLAIGSFVLGPVADRIGRKKVLVASTLFFGAFTVATAFADSLHSLLVIRFLAGLGLGGAMPSFISLTSEYAPRHRRAALVSVLWTGFPIGGVVGGLLASWLIPAYGWQSVFWVGGVLPVVIAFALIAALPESIGFLVTSGAPAPRIAALVNRAFPDARVSADARFVLGEERAPGVPVGQLFMAGRAAGTLLLWVSSFIAFMLLVTNSAWTPILLRTAGIAVAQSAIAMAVFNFGSVIGTAVAGWLVARFGALAVLPVALVGTALSYGLIGYSAPSVSGIMLLEGAFGLFLGCASSGLIALAAIFYPTEIRSTGVGWAMGMGRVGSFTGPLIVAALLAGHWPIADIFAIVGASAILAAITSAPIRAGRAERVA